MPSWLVISIIGSIALTLLLNLLPVLFPKTTRRAQDRMIEDIRHQQEQIDAPEPGPRIRVFFPWKAMLIGSVVLTLLVNVVAMLARG